MVNVQLRQIAQIAFHISVFHLLVDQMHLSNLLYSTSPGLPALPQLVGRHLVDVVVEPVAVEVVAVGGLGCLEMALLPFIVPLGKVEDTPPLPHFALNTFRI